MTYHTPKTGDLVRVVLEDPVKVSRGPGFRIGSNYINPERDHVVSIEILPPPVVTFGPGDVVRSKKHRTNLYTLGRGGHLAHRTGEWCASRLTFTSEFYDLVDLGGDA